MVKKKALKRWEIIDQEIALIALFKKPFKGSVIYKEVKTGAELDRKGSELVFRLGTIDSNDLNVDTTFTFSQEGGNFKIIGCTTAHRSSAKVREGWATRYTEGTVEEIKSVGWRGGAGKFRSYYAAPGSKVLYHIFENIGQLQLTIDGHLFFFLQEEGYLIIESGNTIRLEDYSEISYAILVAFGFVSGNFIQDEVFTFRLAVNDEVPGSIYYRTLRKGSSSIYQALIWNPYGYKHYTGNAMAKKLYQEKTLRPLDIPAFTELVQLTLHNPQVKYALVLFNDTNESSQSLLVRNNCFFIVLEVLRKVFYEDIKHYLPNLHTQKGNTDKAKLVFEVIAPISEDETVTLSKRNYFLHGDIEQFEGGDMMDIMLKQIALIHKLVMSFVGFKGYLLDHYQLRYGDPAKAYVKINGAIYKNPPLD